MDRSHFHPRGRRGTFSRPRRPRRPRRQGLSVVLLVVVLVVLIAFVSLAVDVGRVRVAKAQLQTAADAAAAAGASGLELMPGAGVAEPQDRAADAAAMNFGIDQSEAKHGVRRDHAVELVVDEDLHIGRWDDSQRQFARLEQTNGGIDERRQGDAVRVWARRVTRFEDGDGNVVERGTGLPLIFAPVIGVQTGEVQASATAVLDATVSGAAFVGLDYVRFQGAVRSDSYAAATEQYPGAGGANRNASIASNGDITFTGAATIWGSVHPGRDGWIRPQPLGGNVEITGHMLAMSNVLAKATPAFTLPGQIPSPDGPRPFNQAGTIVPPMAFDADTLRFQPQGETRLVAKPQPKAGWPTNFVFSSWTSNGGDRVVIDNGDGPVAIYVQGAVKHANHARITVVSNDHPVTLHVNGDASLQGEGIIRPPGATPRLLRILMTRPGTTLTIGGSQPLFAHVDAPASDVFFSGNGGAAFHFHGAAVGKSLTVAGNVQLHYDESLEIVPPSFRIRLVE